MSVTLDHLKAAAARELENGHDFRTWTAHRIAHNLMRWDKDFFGADYTTLVALASDWKAGRNT